MATEQVLFALEALLFSVAPVVAACFGFIYSVFSLRETRERRLAAPVALILVVLGVEARDAWLVHMTGSSAYGGFVPETLSTVVSVGVVVALYLVLDHIQEATVPKGDHEGLREEKEELEDANAELKEENLELGRQVRDLKERNNELEVYDEMVESVPDLLFALDEEWRFIEANRATSNVLGYDRDEILGVRFSSLMSEDTDPDLTIKSEEQKVLVEHQMRASGGERFPIELHMARLSPVEGVSKGIVGMGRDITRRKEREQRLEVLNRFFRHNIRNELTVVIGRAEMLVDRIEGDDRELAEIVRDRANVLKNMSEKAREVGSILSGQPERRAVEVSRAIDRGVDAVEVDRDFGIEVDVGDAGGEDGLRAYAIDGVDFAVENLVENAVLHSDEDEPTVRVSASAENGDVTIEVADDGPGIPDHEVEAVRAGNEDPLKHGSGIGLWAVSWVVQLSRGELDFGENDLGGASVRMRFRGAD